MARYILYSRLILTLTFLVHWQRINSCPKKHINNIIAEYKCVPESDNDSDFWKTNLPGCVWNCLSMSTCRHINHNQTADQCVLGFAICESLEPAPGFSVQAFGPAGDVCLNWGSIDEPGRIPVQMHDHGGQPVGATDSCAHRLSPVMMETVYYTFHACSERRNLFLENTPLLIEHFGAASKVQGQALLAWIILMFSPQTLLVTCRWYPTHPVPQFHQALWLVATWLTALLSLYVMYVDDGTSRPAYGYYNPSSKVANYEIGGSRTTTTIYLLILLWGERCGQPNKVKAPIKLQFAMSDFARTHWSIMK